MRARDEAPLRDILQLSKASISFRAIEGRLESGRRRIDLTGLTGSARSLLLSFLLEALSEPLLVLTSDREEAEMVRDDLEGFVGREGVRYYPARDMCPAEERPVSKETIGLRVETLADLAAGRRIIALAPVEAILDRVIPPEALKAKTIHLRVDDTIDFDHFAAQFVDLGFEREPMVEEVGQFSVRGGIVDVHPFASEKPLRLEFCGDTIESIRSFDISTQRSVATLTEATILPCNESWEHGEGNSPAGSGCRSCTLLTYMPEESILFLEEPHLVREKAQRIIEQREATHVRLREGGVQPHFVREYEEIEDQLKSYPVLTHSLVPPQGGEVIDVGTRGQDPTRGNLSLLRESLTRLRKAGHLPFIVCDNRIQAERLEEVMDDLSESIRFGVGHLHHGFLLPDAHLAVYTDHEIFHRHRLPHRRPKYERSAAIQDVETLRRNDSVVHIDHGIGRFEGLRRITAGGEERDCLSILYKNDDRLFVPMDQLHRIQKYVGAEGTVPPLSKLGGHQWERTKERTKRAIADMAADLIKMSATRKAQKGHAFSPPTEWQRELEAAFPYEETPDQLQAAEEVERDMEDPAPMDRLICGDVGYGKTEVAIRATFKAVMDEKQAAILVPTTILAQQHLKTFVGRLAEYPIRVEMLSRFKTRAEQRRIIEDLKKGTVDVVIGTHRLLQKDVQFKDLGLVVVDEEQRFGVTHKERLKKLRTLVDVLTLTATPIPRTLHLSLMGARDMSVINTAPKDRLPIHTEIVRFDEDLIREAILREVARGGQVYFVHNRVQSIHAVATLLKKIAPQISFGIAHGQMDEGSLEQVMIDFLEMRFDCLISTMIIEAGLDIPNVNTIIINRADRFGLAQLYQLRGRVGRSDKLAYAYLLVPPVRSLTGTARERLQALEEFTELGSGFQLALRDLEIRGAGNILGPQQHGSIAAVGFDLYCRLLDDAVRELKGESTDETLDPKIELPVDAYIPDEYVHDGEQKMLLYQRLAKIPEYEEVLDMENELRDRFGTIPRPVRALLGVISLRTLARRLGLTRVALSGDTLLFQFPATHSLTLKQIETLVSNSPAPLEFEGETGLVAKADVTGRTGEEALGFAKNVLLHLV